MRLLGILLVIFGVILLLYQGITLFIPQGQDSIGPFTLAVNENLSIPMPPILGVFCLVIGILMVMSAPEPAPPY